MAANSCESSDSVDSAAAPRRSEAPYRRDARFETPDGSPIHANVSIALLLGGTEGKHSGLVAQILRKGLPHRTELGLDRDEDTAETSVG